MKVACDEEEPFPYVVSVDTSPLVSPEDGDDARPSNAAVSTVPAWQMPQLVVDRARKGTSRLHKGTSLILPDAGGDLIAGIVGGLPSLLQLRPCWHLGYSLATDGVSLRTLFRMVSHCGPCILVVEDSNNSIFGAFMSEGLKPVSQCCGTHECFIFRYPRAAGAWRTEVFHWVVAAKSEAPTCCVATAEGVGTQEYSGMWATYFGALHNSQASAMKESPASVTFCDHSGIVVGIDGPGLFIDEDLLRGVSWPSQAFGSPALTAAGSDFVVRNLEVWHWSERSDDDG